MTDFSNLDKEKKCSESEQWRHIYALFHLFKITPVI